MNLTTPNGLRTAIEREVSEISGATGGDQVTLPDKEIDDLVSVLSQMPEVDRESQMRNMVNDLVQRRLGDPSVS